MQIRRVRTEEAAIRRFVTECWMPCHEELSKVNIGYGLVENAAEEGVEYHLDQLDSSSDRLWVALDGVDDPTAPLDDVDATFAGFVRTGLRPSPGRFDWDDRLEIENMWVAESYRGSGLADDLLARAVQQAGEDACEDLRLTVGVDNDRAVSYFERHGFEVQGFGMHVPLTDVDIDGSDHGAEMPSSPRFRRVRAEESVMRWFVEECWIPFWDDLGDAVGKQHLNPDLDRDELVEELVETYDTADRRCWVALDDVENPTAPLDEIEAVFAGWINAGQEPVDQFLDPPERLFVGNLYAAPGYRGTGLTDHLVARAMQYAREEGCTELALGVEIDNDRAMAYYEKRGFEPFGQSMTVPVDELEL